ncbi:MAG: CoA transferase [Ottowia sp.]|uniref:CaiB/BaiF CoA transferase family protein n=1 Tax=Ottowia sp. TaxID=1898956 RepID=UPI003C731908
MISPTSAAFAPLSGLRVLDLTKVLAGPLCTQYLGDLGADVIKVETCGGGDDTRLWPPFIEGDGAVFLSANRNKRSIALNLKSPAGLEAALRLAEQADVVVESYRKGVMERLGLGYDALKARNPKLIYASISGFGRNGPLSGLPGYDIMMQAFTGIMGITGEKGGNPVRCAFSPIDQTTGIWAAFGIMAALKERDSTGVGQYLEASLFETSMAFMGYTAQTYWATGKRPERSGSGHESLCPYQAFRASDAFILIAVGNDKIWQKFCSVAGLEHIRDDPRYRTNPDRVAHFDETVKLVSNAVRTQTAAYWSETLTKAGVPNALIHDLDHVLEMPHTVERDIVLDYEDEVRGPQKGLAMPVVFNGGARSVRKPPPTLGAHTAEILKEAGYTNEQIQEMVCAGTAQDRPSSFLTSRAA